MTEEQVTSALGPPDDRMTTGDFLRDQSSRAAFTLISGPLPEQDYWIYFDRPRGYDTEIIIENGRVVSVKERRRA
jgi:hypothetical protein